MGVRENKVENHLKKEAKKLGFISRKWVSPGHSGVPDQILIKSVKVSDMIERLLKMKSDSLVADFHLVEVKTVDGEYEPGQEREHKRLSDVGAKVYTVWGEAGVNVLIRRLTGKPICGGCHAHGNEPHMVDGECSVCERTQEQIDG